MCPTPPAIFKSLNRKWSYFMPKTFSCLSSICIIKIILFFFLAVEYNCQFHFLICLLVTSGVLRVLSFLHIPYDFWHLFSKKKGVYFQWHGNRYTPLKSKKKRHSIFFSSRRCRRIDNFGGWNTHPSARLCM